MQNNKWDKRFLEQAQQVSMWSKDRSTKVGAVVVKDKQILATGFNGFPVGVDDEVDSRHERPAKYLYTEHAERNCIYQASKIGLSLKGATLYLNYGPAPCADCTRAIIQTGIKEIVTTDINFPGIGSQWREHFEASLNMLKEAGVVLRSVQTLPAISATHNLQSRL